MNALLDEIEAAFDMSSIEPAEALLVLDPVEIPVATNHSQFGINKLSVLYNFYGNISKDTYQQCTIESPALINCTLESLTLEYSGYKNYVDSRKKQITKETEAQLNIANTCLWWAHVDKFKSKKSTKAIESEISSLHEKIKIPLNVFGVLKDSVIESAFPNICYLVKLLAIVPMSEAVVEHRFSNMKLIIRDQRTSLDEKGLDAFMCISFHLSPLHCDEVKQIVNDWKHQCHRRIFSADI